MNGFRKHLTKSHKKYIADRLCSQRINCPVQTCSKDRQVNLKLEGFVNHLRVNHLTVSLQTPPSGGFQKRFLGSLFILTAQIHPE